MRWTLGFFFCALTLSGQIPAHYLEIKLPASVDSERFFGRYRLRGDDFGGWLQPAPGVNSYVIDTAVHGHPASGIKAILYAPGCAIQTLDLPLSRTENAQYSFACQRVGRSSIAGTLTQPERLYTQDVDVQARYVPRWAQAFLGLSDGMVTSIPIGEAVHLSAGGHFRLMIPDLSEDPPPRGDRDLGDGKNQRCPSGGTRPHKRSIATGTHERTEAAKPVSQRDRLRPLSGKSAGAA
jgi:hypothetical protein